MNIEDQIQALEKKMEALINGEPGVFLVEIRIKPTNNVKVFVDADSGVNIDKLVQYNRKLYRDLEENSFFPGGDFSLEISSPGLDEPLKLYRQYLKNIGRYAEVVQNDGIKIEGKLVSATESEIVVEEEKARLTGKNKKNEVGQGKNKKKEVIKHIISFDNIKTTIIQIKF
jgi:ribosome maturation factor RimP